MHFLATVTRKIQGISLVMTVTQKKTLGLFWQANLDKLKYVIKIKSDTFSVTKRGILSVVSQIFDPLRLVGPVVVQAKLILQKLWQLNLEWDKSVPTEVFTSWKLSIVN